MDIYLCKIDLYKSIFIYFKSNSYEKNANYEQYYIFNKNA